MQEKPSKRFSESPEVLMVFEQSHLDCCHAPGPVQRDENPMRVKRETSVFGDTLRHFARISCFRHGRSSGRGTSALDTPGKKREKILFCE